MCEIFPEVETCCGVMSVRVGMVLLAALSITTGAFSLAFIEQKSNISFNDVVLELKNATKYTTPRQFLSILPKIIAMVIAAMSFVFMVAGLALLYSTLADEEGFAQVFVWLVFFNIFIGFFMVLAVSFMCSYGNSCLFRGMDWLSLATTIVASLCYLLLWYYFCCVANSYVLNAYT